MISLICFTIFFFLLLTLFKKGTDIFSPARLYTMIWSAAIGLAQFKLSRFQYEWSAYSWIMLLICVSGTLIGMFVVFVMNQNRKIYRIENIREMCDKINYKYDRLYYIIIALFSGYIISYIASYLLIGYIPLFTKFPGAARIEWGVFGFGLLVQAFPTVFFLAVLYLIKSNGGKIKKLVVAGMMLSSLVTYALLLQRYYIIFPFVLCIIVIYYTTRFLKPRNLIIVLSVFMLVFYGVSTIRLSGTMVNYLYYLSAMKYHVKYAVFTEPYMYVVMNLENFAHAVDRFTNFSYGVGSFDFLFALVGIKHSLGEYMRLTDYPFLLSNSFNTYTMYFVYYQDFGIIGVALFPFILGVLFSRAYYQMRIKPYMHSIALYSIFAFVIILSFFVPIITFLHFVFNASIIYYSLKLIQVKKAII